MTKRILVGVMTFLGVVLIPTVAAAGSSWT